MIIREMQINGFGMYADAQFTIEQPFTLFYGKNEAGKSTLFQFIRAILFGFPTRAQKTGMYEPQRGGRHGGALLIEMDGTIYRMERYGDRRREPSVSAIGTAKDDGHLLLERLRNFTADTYRQLFAFGLEELQEIRTLQSEDVGRYLFHAGLGTSAAHLMEVEKQLLQEMDQLYRPRGRNQPMYRLVKQAEDLRMAIQKSMEEQGQYVDLMEQIRRLEEQIKRDERELDSLMVTKHELEMARKIAEPLERLRLIEARLEDTPRVDSVPLKAIERWEKMNEEDERLRTNIGQLEQELDELRARKAQIHVDDDLLARREDVERLWEASAIFTDQLQRRTAIETEILQLEQDLQANLRRVGDRFTVKDLLVFPMSIAERKQIEDFLARYDEHVNRLHTVRLEHEKRLEIAMEEKMQWQSLISELNERQKQEEHLLQRHTTFTPEAFAHEAESFLHTIDRWDEVNRQIDMLSDRLRDMFMLDPDTAPRSLFQQISRVVLLIAPILIAPILFVFGWDQAAWVLLALGIGGGLSWFISRSTRERRTRAVTYQSSRLEIEEKLNQLQEERNRLEQQLERFTSRVWQADNEVASSSAVNGHKEKSFYLFSQMQTYRRFLEEQLQRHRKWREEQHDLKRQADRQRNRYESAQLRAEQMGQVRVELEQKLDELDQTWQSWIDKYRLSSECTPDLMPVVFQVIDKSYHLHEQWERKKQQLNALEEQIHTFKEQVKPFVHVTEPMQIVPALKVLKDEMEDNEEQARRKEALSEKIQLLQIQKNRLQFEKQRVDEQRQALLNDADVFSEEELYEKCELYELRRSLKEEKRQIETMLANWLNENERNAAIQRLQTESPLQIEHHLQECEEKLRSVSERLNEMKQQLGRFMLRKEQLQSGTEHATLLQTYEEARTSLLQTAEKWAVRAFMIELFRRAKEKYEQERQPKVMKLASQYFSILTEGAYQHVMAPFGEKRLIVERSNGEQVDMAQLSRGTAEQLYLAMRLALAQEYGKQFGTFPIIMDDVLVNFDAQRMKAALQLFSEQSKQQQILMFTCHEHIRSAFMNIVQEGAIIHMDDTKTVRHM